MFQRNEKKLGLIRERYYIIY